MYSITWVDLFVESPFKRLRPSLSFSSSETEAKNRSEVSSSCEVRYIIQIQCGISFRKKDINNFKFDDRYMTNFNDNVRYVHFLAYPPGKDKTNRERINISFPHVPSELFSVLKFYWLWLKYLHIKQRKY